MQFSDVSQVCFIGEYIRNLIENRYGLICLVGLNFDFDRTKNLGINFEILTMLERFTVFRFYSNNRDYLRDKHKVIEEPTFAQPIHNR